MHRLLGVVVEMPMPLLRFTRPGIHYAGMCLAVQVHASWYWTPTSNG